MSRITTGNVFWGVLLIAAALLLPRVAWAAQESPVVCGPETVVDKSAIVASGSGYQVVEFTIEEAGTYKMTVDIAPASSVFVSVDVVTIDDTSQILTFPVSSSEAGSFSSADELEPGAYYFDVISSGAEWTITLMPMGAS